MEDDSSLRESLVETLRERYPEVSGAGTAGSAARALEERPPDLLLLDVALPDGSAFDVLEVAARLEPAPVVVALSGAAGPEQSFALAQRGVRVYLRKPLGAEALERALDEALSEPPDLRPQLRATVGHRPIREVESEVRATMVAEALARSGGSKRAAARLLSISRQLLQYIVRPGAG